MLSKEDSTVFKVGCCCPKAVVSLYRFSADAEQRTLCRCMNNVVPPVLAHPEALSSVPDPTRKVATAGHCHSLQGEAFSITRGKRSILAFNHCKSLPVFVVP